MSDTLCNDCIHTELVSPRYDVRRTLRRPNEMESPRWRLLFARCLEKAL